MIRIIAIMTLKYGIQVCGKFLNILDTLNIIINFLLSHPNSLMNEVFDFDLIQKSEYLFSFHV